MSDNHPVSPRAVKFFFAFLLVGVFARLSGGEPQDALRFIDEYLARWDEFARGQNSLGTYLRGNKARFEAELSSLLRAGDKNAAGRVVFYAVVQVGGFIDSQSELGREVTKALGAFPLVDGEDGRKMIFAGDLYFWWEMKKRDYPAFALYEEWLKRDFTQNTVLRLYSGVRENEKKGKG